MRRGVDQVAAEVLEHPVAEVIVIPTDVALAAISRFSES